MTEYIEIRNWDRFQHSDATKRGRDPVWIKNYTRLLSDEMYLNLTPHQRAVLHGLWLEYARSGRQLPLNTASLTRRLNLKITIRQLEALNHAGFLEFRQDIVTPPSSLEERREEKKKQLPPPPQIEAPKARPERTRDLSWEALLDVCGITQSDLTNTGRGVANKALKELKAAGADPDEIRERAAEFQRRYQLPLTPSALTKHWGALRTGEQVNKSKLASIFGVEAA